MAEGLDRLITVHLKAPDFVNLQGDNETGATTDYRVWATIQDVGSSIETEGLNLYVTRNVRITVRQFQALVNTAVLQTNLIKVTDHLGRNYGGDNSVSVSFSEDRGRFVHIEIAG